LSHHECATRDSRQTPPEDARRFAEMLKAHGITIDPYYHPSLTATSKSPQLKPDAAMNVQENLQKLIESDLQRDETEVTKRRAA
jgi:hypothetical protein